MRVELIPQSKKDRVIGSFSEREWKRFDRQLGYKWNAKRYTFCAYDGKKVVGCAEVGMNGGAAYLRRIIVAESQRGRGIGRLLLDKFERFAKAKKCHVAYLDTSEVHKEALKFYRRNGYRVIARLKDNKFHLDWYSLAKRLRD